MAKWILTKKAKLANFGRDVDVEKVGANFLIIDRLYEGDYGPVTADCYLGIFSLLESTIYVSESDPDRHMLVWASLVVSAGASIIPSDTYQQQPRLAGFV